jgi:hypothetical protein
MATKKVPMSAKVRVYSTSGTTLAVCMKGDVAVALDDLVTEYYEH